MLVAIGIIWISVLFFWEPDDSLIEMKFSRRRLNYLVKFWFFVALGFIAVALAVG